MKQGRTAIDRRDLRLFKFSASQFSGEIEEWVRFRDTFQEMVLRNANLHTIFKMHYLSEALTGEAAKLLGQIPASGDNFLDAWKLIKSHYDNARLPVTKLLSKFMKIPAMSAEDAHEISRVHSSIKNILQALKTAGSPVDHWAHFTVFLTPSRLSPPIQRQWEEVVAQSTTPQDPPTFKTLDKFLETERLALTQLEIAEKKHISK